MLSPTLDSRVAVCLLAMISFAAGSPAQAQSGPPSTPAAAKTGKIDQKLAAIFTKAHAEGRFNGSVLIGRKGKVLLRRDFGMASFENAIPINEKTRFKLFSTTKHFTAVAIMLLQDQGKLSATDPVRKFFPEFPSEWQGVTIRHLLTHSSGIPDFAETLIRVAVPGQAGSVVEAVKALEGKALIAAPGERFAYSNAGYTILGGVVERASGITYERFVVDNILAPSGMKRSGVEQGVFDVSRNPPPDFGSMLIPDLATGYNGLPNALAATVSKMYVIQGAGGIYSTAEDLWKYDNALRQGAPVPLATQQRMVDEAFAPPNMAKIAYGWLIRQRHGRQMISHSGGNNGFAIEYARIPSEEICVIILSNLGFVNPEGLRDEVLNILLAE